MSDRSNIYELLEDIHREVFPHDSVGEYLKKLNEIIGPVEKLSDGELVTRLSGYRKSPFHLS
jgi:hypothetical protein